MPQLYILTGAPGAGKTALIRRLETLGHDVVEEAATDVISLEQADGVDQPWERPRFISDIAALQQFRESAPMRGSRRFSDRSIFCTLALAQWLGHPVPDSLLAEADEIIAARWFEPRVFFIAQLGFIQNTEARRISLDEATRFGALHEDVYRRYGFELVPVAPGSIEARVAAMLAAS